MQEIDLGSGGRFRVWLGELPTQSVEYDAVAEKNYPILQKHESVAFDVAAEILIPRGARSLYGLLGGHFSPDSTGRLLVSMPILNISSKRLYSNALAGKFDEVSCGLLTEYAEFVAQGIDVAIERGARASSGKLTLSCSANGAASSNGPIFRALGYWIVKTWGMQEAVSDQHILKEALSV